MLFLLDLNIFIIFFFFFVLGPTNNLFIINLVNTENSCKKKTLYIIHCIFFLFFVSGMCTFTRGRGNRIKQLLTSTSNFMLITPSTRSSPGQIDLGYIGVPARSPSAATST